MPDLVIFDCDGVLVDSEPIAVRTHARVLGELGWPITEQEVIERFVGRSTASINELIEARLGAERTAEADRRFTRLHAEAVDAGLLAVDGIADALAQIGIPVCVASSGSHDKMSHTLGRTGLYEYFAGRIFSATEVARGKPAPDLFLHAAARMGAALPTASWLRTAGTACRRHAPLACAPSVTRAASHRRNGSRAQGLSSSPTCASSPI